MMPRPLPTFLPSVICALAGCAAEGPSERRANPSVAEIARSLGCGRNEVAVCIDVNCEPEDYRCAPRASARDLLSGEFEPPQR